MKPVLLLDCDGVIADCSSVVHRFAEIWLERELPAPETWTEWDHALAMGMTGVEAETFHYYAVSSPFPHSIALFPGAREAVIGLKEHYEIVFVTSPWRGNKYWVPARELLLEEFGCEVIFTSAKHRVLGDILVDDKPENILRGGPCREYVTYDRLYNRHVPGPRIKELWELIGKANTL